MIIRAPFPALLKFIAVQQVGQMVTKRHRQYKTFLQQLINCAIILGAQKRDAELLDAAYLSTSSEKYGARCSGRAATHLRCSFDLCSSSMSHLSSQYGTWLSQLNNDVSGFVPFGRVRWKAPVFAVEMTEVVLFGGRRF